MSKMQLKVITKLPNSEQSHKGKVKTHNYINRQNQSTTENCENRNDPDLVQAFLKKWWVESDFDWSTQLDIFALVGGWASPNIPHTRCTHCTRDILTLR